MPRGDIRYFRWRGIYGTRMWLFDRHWYGMLGALHMGNRPASGAP